MSKPKNRAVLAQPGIALRHGQARAVHSVRFAEPSEPVATEAPEFSEPAELPTPKSWRHKAAERIRI